jgi:hypothetical protein
MESALSGEAKNTNFTLWFEMTEDQTDDLPHSHYYITEVGNFIDILRVV